MLDFRPLLKENSEIHDGSKSNPPLAIDDFIPWYCSESGMAFNETVAGTV
jgi:hypothetical protein